MIGSDISAALPELRANAESLMVDACEIRERSTSTTYNETTNQVVPTAGALVYSGKCRIRQVTAEQTVDLAEQTVTTLDYRITLPWSVGGLKVDQLVTVTASSDSQLVLPLTIVNVQAGSLRYHRLIICSYNLG